MKKLVAALTLALSSSASFAITEIDTSEGYLLRCEALIGENPDKLVISQEYDFSGKTEEPLVITLHTFDHDGGRTDVSLNEHGYVASEHYIRLKDNSEVAIANLRAKNDGLEEIANVEFSAANKNESKIKAIRNSSDGRQVIQASGESVECVVVPL